MKAIKDKYFNVVTNKESGIPEIFLYGYIGQDLRYSQERKEESITDLMFVQTLRSLEEKHKRINCRINSPGGSMFHGNSIITSVRSSKAEIHMYNDGLAGSMAAEIWTCVNIKRRHMPSNALLMKHSPINIEIGNALDFRTAADLLDKFQETLVNNNVDALGWEAEKVKNTFFDYKDHWITAVEAKAMGLIEDVDTYEVKNKIENIENMSYEDILNHFTESDDQEAQGWLQKMYNRITNTAKHQKHIISNASKNSEMNINEFKASLEDNSLSIEDVQKVLNEKGFVVAKVEAVTTPAEKTAEEVKPPDISAVIEAAIKPLTDKIAALQGKIDKLEAGPGAGATKGKSAGDDYPPDQGEEEDELDKFNKAMNAAAQNHRVMPIQ